jgi:hypothetical protein
MRNHSHASFVVFVKRNVEYLPTTMDGLQEHLQNILDSWFVERLIFFGVVLRGTHACWSKCYLTWFIRLGVHCHSSHWVQQTCISGICDIALYNSYILRERKQMDTSKCN